MAYQHEIKQTNLKTAFDLVRNGVCVSRSELAREMKLSATAVSSIVDELIRLNLFVEVGPIATDTPGRRPMNIKLNENEKQIAVFSLCCAEIRFTLFNLAFDVLEELKFPYMEKIRSEDERGEAYASLFEDILLNHSKLADRGRLLAVCISFPGSYTSNEKYFSAKASLDAAVRPEILERFIRNTGTPAFVANRTMCMAYAEKQILSAHGEAANDLIFVNISDFIGSALISGGNVYTGPNDTAGDIGHLCVDTEGRACACGGTDCLQHYLNLGALLKDAQEACALEKLPAPGSFDALAAQYGSNPAVDRVISAAAERLARALAMLVYVSSTDRIVISGGIRALGENFLNEVSGKLSRYVYARNHTLSFAQSGDDSDSIGIAQYLMDKTDEIFAKNLAV